MVNAAFNLKAACEGHVLRESGKVKLRHFVETAGRTLEELSEVVRALDSGRLSEELLRKVQLLEEDYDKPLIEPRQGVLLSALGKAKVRQFVEQAKTLDDLEELQAALAGGEISRRLRKKLKLVDSDFLSPVVKRQGEEADEGLRWEEFERRVERRRAHLEELQEMVLVALSCRDSAGTKEAAAAVPSRRDFQRKLFEFLDADGNGRLGSFEMLGFARLGGFEGHAEEWKAEFSALCRDLGESTNLGLDMDAFMRATNSLSKRGCYCSTRDLGSMACELLTERSRKRDAAAASVGGPRPASARPSKRAAQGLPQERRRRARSTTSSTSSTGGTEGSPIQRKRPQPPASKASAEGGPRNNCTSPIARQSSFFGA
eukprot:TRINITY_DN18116_c0_g1_i1.p1 TRINITY_DN18116_c0_g1~~TRINITY_DN18116_c0_g1_i1.p1  ORF type:complete len:373 (-),score=97.85 TRINITY_DN18116_c0_g1_i1:351-1469(-)